MKPTKKPKTQTAWYRRLFISQADSSALLENVAMMMHSGFDLSTALEAVQAETDSKAMNSVVVELRAAVDSGMPFWQALEETTLFPEHMISLVRIGEQSGRLPENLVVIVTQERKSTALRQKIQSAIAYPSLVLGLTFVIGLLLAWVVLPKLTTVFTGMNISLPLITRIVIAFGVFVQQYGMYAFPTLIAVVIVGIFLIFVNPSTNGIGEWILFRLSGIGTLVRSIEVARFGSMLGNLLGSGLPVLESIRSIEATSTTHVYRAFLKVLGDDIEEGLSFKSSFEKYPHSRSLIPGSAQQLITVGEQSGRLKETLDQIGRTYETKADAATQSLTVLLEPALLFVVWLGVLFIALAIILPIYNLVGQFN